MDSPMLRKTYDWTMEKAQHRHAVWWLAAISFMESSFFPIPPDVLLIPMVLAAPTRWFPIAFVCTASSVAGGYFGYGIGYFAMDTLGSWLLGVLHLTDQFHALKPTVDKWGVWMILVIAWTPIPYKLGTIAAGAFAFDPLLFGFASFIGRGGRFFAVAILLYYFGPPIRSFIEKRLAAVTCAAVLLAVLGFLVLR